MRYNKGRLPDLRIKKELPRVKARCRPYVVSAIEEIWRTFSGNKIRYLGDEFK